VSVRAQLEQWFPRLKQPSEWECSSPWTDRYNCIACAADDESIRWWPTPVPVPGWYWPPGIGRAPTAPNFQDAFEGLGYEVCSGGELEPGYEKVAIFEKAGEVEHAARQLPDGRWQSKLGEHVDITHKGVEAAGMNTRTHNSPALLPDLSLSRREFRAAGFVVWLHEQHAGASRAAARARDG
jgi:hypothetical protein